MFGDGFVEVHDGSGKEDAGGLLGAGVLFTGDLSGVEFAFF